MTTVIKDIFIDITIHMNIISGKNIANDDGNGSKNNKCNCKNDYNDKE